MSLNARMRTGAAGFLKEDLHSKLCEFKRTPPSISKRSNQFPSRPFLNPSRITLFVLSASPLSPTTARPFSQSTTIGHRRFIGFWETCLWMSFASPDPADAEEVGDAVARRDEAGLEM